MRSFNLIRSICCTGLAIGLLAGAALASAQDATTEPTEDMMMSQMLSLPGACPEGEASAMLTSMMGTSTEAPMMSATEDTGMMTETPMMDMTADMSAMTEMPMTGTEEMGGVKCLFGTFSGLAEVPGPGAPSAEGFVFVSIDPASGEVCYQEALANITLPAAATHIHVNSAGMSGDVVVPFPTAPGSDGLAEGCTTITVEGLAQAIASNPQQYYVNVHTSDFPNGAARAQLSAWDSSMMNGTGPAMTPAATMDSGMGTTGSTGMDMTATPMSPEATVSANG